MVAQSFIFSSFFLTIISFFVLLILIHKFNFKDELPFPIGKWERGELW